MEREKPKPLCWGCGYCLEGAVSKRCPECGREFDPADPKTMNMSGTQSWMKRWFMRRPLGNVALAWCLIATAALVAVTRPRADSIFKIDWTFPDLAFVSTPAHWSFFSSASPDRSWVMILFCAAIVLWALFLLMALPRMIVRAILRRGHGASVVKLSRWRAWIFVAMFFVAIACVLLGQDFRIAHQWSRRILWTAATSYPLRVYGSTLVLYPTMPEQREIEILTTGLRRLPGTEERIAMLRGLVERTGATASINLREEIEAQGDIEVRAALIHLAGMSRDEKNLPTLVKHLDHADARIRAAAIDAIGIIRVPAWAKTRPVNAELNTNPGINPVNIEGGFYTSDAQLRAIRVKEIDSGLRVRFEKFMLAGATAMEREAAARALLRWPKPNYQLRVAEWGVWISNEKGDLSLMQSVIDEIPPFVHRTGNSEKALAGRIEPNMMPVTKPVIHLTANGPMVVDVGVSIVRGQPWFAYPRPDDFDFLLTNDEPTLATRPAIPASIGDLQPLGVGYPWLLPRHRTQVAPYSWGYSPSYWSIGLRWQSLIVTPDPLASSTIAEVPSDPKFAWWNRLRKVPTSYITSNGQTERFLYYDGPTTLPSPTTVALVNHKAGEWIQFRPTANNWVKRQGLFIRVRDKVATAWRLDDLRELMLPVPQQLEENAYEQFLKMLMDAGLTQAEAAGMADAWSPQFFKTEGDRFLLFLTREDYDMYCPLTVSPPASQTVRVGVVLTELR